MSEPEPQKPKTPKPLHIANFNKINIIDKLKL